MELHFHRWNSETQPETGRIVFLHGMGGTGALWRPIAANLENEFSILAPDQRGHGKSRPVQPETYLPLDYARDVSETLESQKFSPAWVVGHSMGVRTACALAHLRPDAVQGLILIDLGFSGMAGGGLGEGLAKFIKILPPGFPTRAEAREFMTQHCPDPSIAQYLMAVSQPAPGGGISFPFDHQALVATIYAARDFSVRDWVAEAGARSLPVLVLRGANSLVWTHEEFMSEKNAMSSYSSIVFEEMEGTGHGLPFEKRVAFVERVRKFIRES